MVKWQYKFFEKGVAMLEILADAVLDTLKLMPLLFAANVLIELLEHTVVGKIRAEKALKGGFAPLIGAGVGLLPQCGFSVVAAKMYSSRHIGMGTLLAVFVATSDEAIPILLSSPTSAARLLPLLAVKFLGALIIGYSVSIVLSRRDKKNIVDTAEGESFHVVGCHGHSLVDEENKHKLEHTQGDESVAQREENEAARKKTNRKILLDRFLWHPLVHTLTVSLYILAVNLLLGVVIFFITEERLASFMSSVRFLQPLVATVIGLIPNCASSVAIAELYGVGTLSLGGAVAGLSVNAGLGLAVLFKENRRMKENFMILALLAVFGAALGTATEAVVFALGF
ncbi:MAG: arsenic efflux protein [Clostridia bacterium]|nr:arsenic efflux protein [Clostridia bacterium]